MAILLQRKGLSLRKRLLWVLNGGVLSVSRKSWALREAAILLQTFKLLHRGVTLLPQLLGYELGLGVLRYRGVVGLIVLRRKGVFVLRKALRLGVRMRFDSSHLTHTGAQVQLALLRVQVGVYVLEGGINHVLTRLRVLLIQMHRLMAIVKVALYLRGSW